MASSIFDVPSRTIKGRAKFNVYGWTLNSQWINNSGTIGTQTSSLYARKNEPIVNTSSVSKTFYLRAHNSFGTGVPSMGYLVYDKNDTYVTGGSLPSTIFTTEWTYTAAAGAKIYFNCGTPTYASIAFEYSWDGTNYTQMDGPQQIMENIEATWEESFTNGEGLTMGYACINEMKLKIIEADTTINYQMSPFYFYLMGSSNGGTYYTTWTVGIFYPKEATYNDDGSVEIDSYDYMSCLDVTYVPTVTTPCSPRAVVEDICSQYGLTASSGAGLVGGTLSVTQLLSSGSGKSTRSMTSDGVYSSYWGYKIGKGTYDLVPDDTYPQVTIKNVVADDDYFGVVESTPSIIWQPASGETVTLYNSHRYAILLYPYDDMEDELGIKLYDTNGSLIDDLEGYGDFWYYPEEDVNLGSIRVYELNRTSAGIWMEADEERTYTVQVFDVTDWSYDDRYALYYQGMQKGIYFGKVTGQSWTYGTFLNELYEGTVAEQLGWMAGLQGQNAYIYDAKSLKFNWYGTSAYEALPRDYQCENGVKLTSEKINLDSLTSGTEENPIVKGSGKGITFYNPYMTQALLDDIWDTFSAHNNRSYYSGSVEDFGSMNRRTFNVKRVVDKDGNYKFFMPTSQTWTINGGLKCQAECEGNEDAATSLDTSTKRGTISQKLTTLEESQVELSTLINSAEGGCITWLDTNNDGVNDGLKAANSATNPSKYLILNYNGIGLSNDGSSVYQNAITQDGIVANAINTGTLNAINITSCAINNGSGTFSVNNSGYMTAAQGKIGNWQIATDTKGLYNDNGNYRVYLQGYQSSSGHYGDTWCYSTQNTSTGNPYSYLTFDGEAFFEGSGTFGGNNYSNETLSVTGSSYFDGNLKCEGQMSAGGNGFASSSYNLTVWDSGVYAEGGYYNGSREELKTNITPCQNMLDVVNDTEIYQYDLRKELEKENHCKHYGVVIGDSYLHTPDEILSADGQSVDMYNMVSVLWKSVQELSAEVDDLKTQLEEANK